MIYTLYKYKKYSSFTLFFFALSLAFILIPVHFTVSHASRRQEFQYKQKQEISYKTHSTTKEYPIIKSNLTTKITQSKDFDVQSIINEISFKDKVGQLFAFSYLGNKINKNSRRVIYNLRPGSIITFKRNIASPYRIAQLNKQITQLITQQTGVTPFIMVDQEGGFVTRIVTGPPPPSALSIGMTQKQSYSRRLGNLTGHLLNNLGFHMNLAPVIDASNPYKRSFIGNRSYGENYEMIQGMAQPFVEALSYQNIIPTLKHFPGHGGLVQDSHFRLPTKLSTAQELDVHGSRPFRQFIASGIPFAIMVAHIAFPNIDGSGRPATFSRILIKNLLRKRYGYNGLVITDDLEMAGADFIPDIGERAIEAIQAGCDILIMSGTYGRQEKAYKAVYRAIKNGRITTQRFNESLERILKEKNRIGLFNSTPQRQPQKRLSHIIRDYQRNMDQLISSVLIENMRTSFKKYPHLKGSMDKSQKIKVFTAHSSFYKNIKKRTLAKPTLYLLRKKKFLSIDKVMEKKPQNIGLFYVSGVGTARILNHLTNATKSRLIVVNTTYPGLISQPQRLKAVLNINTQHPRAGEWVVKYLMNRNSKRPSSRIQAKRSENPMGSQ